MMSDKEILSRWMIENGYATGHGDTLGDLVAELAWQHTARIADLKARIAKLEAAILWLNKILRTIPEYEQAFQEQLAKGGTR